MIQFGLNVFGPKPNRREKIQFLKEIEPFWQNYHRLVWFSGPIRFCSPLFPLICCVLSVVSRTEEEEHQTEETYCQIPLQYDSFPNLSATIHVFWTKTMQQTMYFITILLHPWQMMNQIQNPIYLHWEAFSIYYLPH